MEEDMAKQGFSLSRKELREDDTKGIGPIKQKEPYANGRLSDQRYKAFIENISDGVYEVDIHGNFIYFNDALCKVFGYKREEMQWQNFSHFMSEENAGGVFTVFNKIYKTGKGFSDLLWEIVDRDGKTRIIELSAYLITNKESEKVGFRGIARDVTERIMTQKALQESEFQLQCQYEISRKAEKQYRTLLDFVPYPMVVFSLDGKVIYLNPAFTETFGWTLQELEGKKIPYVPSEFEKETSENIRKLLDEKMNRRHESRRLTKDGRVLDVAMRGAVYSEGGEQDGQLVILRDISHEKRMARNNEALLRISMALPRYPELEDLLDYVTSEVKQLLDTEGALIILLDEERKELFFQGAAYEDKSKQTRAKEIRFPADKGVSGRVIRSGKEAVVHDTSKDSDFYSVVDEELGFHTRSMLTVPLRGRERITGVLSAINKKEGTFDQKDVELLNMVAGTVALSIENARFSKELKVAYQEVTSLNRAKDKVINHLSHELKTPVSVLLASLNILSKKLAALPEREWRSTIERAHRNLERVLEIQYQVEDIMKDEGFKAYALLSTLLDECADELEALVAEEVGEGPIVRRLREHIDKVFGPKESTVSEIKLDNFLRERIEVLRPQFSHRQLDIITHLKPVPTVCVPQDVLQKVVDGLLKNAVENTPDEGRIEIIVHKKGDGSELVVYDCGIGITEENQKRIFEGFFTTQETMAYSSKRPFDFNAGGKGADLLRMKIFAERYNFKIKMESSRCKFIPKDNDICPGKISKCDFCEEKGDCTFSGSTAFVVFFPPAPERGCTVEDN
ncbi:MAG: PAS domain S-box protein [Pseudomonadota bacterium]